MLLRIWCTVYGKYHNHSFHIFLILNIHLKTNLQSSNKIADEFVSFVCTQIQMKVLHTYRSWEAYYHYYSRRRRRDIEL